MKNMKVEFTNERIIPAAGLAAVGAILGKSEFVKHCNHMDVTQNRSQHQIKNGDILLTYIGLLTMGKPVYGAVHGECEKFYREIKTDMDLEILPSDKFETNELVLENLMPILLQYCQSKIGLAIVNSQFHGFR